jgi:nucleoside-diphosphate-sugar epimerase
MIRELSAGRDFALATDGAHTWNYLHETDAARALRMLGEGGKSNGVFNLAGSENIPLREYVERVRQAVRPAAAVRFGAEKSGVNLNVSIERIVQAIGWSPRIAFTGAEVI